MKDAGFKYIKVKSVNVCMVMDEKLHGISYNYFTKELENKIFEVEKDETGYMINDRYVPVEFCEDV